MHSDEKRKPFMENLPIILCCDRRRLSIGQAGTCICTAFLVFNSPQLTVSIVTGWEELKTENDIQDIWCLAVLGSMVCGLKRPR